MKKMLQAYGPRQAFLAAGIAASAVAFALLPALRDRFASRPDGGGIGWEEVRRHSSSEDCWLVVDGQVFDLSEQSRQHPSLFSCGQDGSANYHKNHGPVIRERMMPFKVGDLDEASRFGTPGGGEGAADDREISPRSELFAQQGSWDPLDLMVVMERDNRSLLMIDGSTHRAVGRVSDIGAQVHTQVFSPDGRYAYHISRDGWLTKIDLSTLEPVGHLRVGEDSRGTAITQSGKFVAVGNYEPRDVAIVDAASLTLASRVALSDTEGGGLSRAGALVDVGETLLVALKDARSVWAIDTTRRGMEVTRRFWDIGEEGDVLHDGFLTPDGRHFLVAVQGSDRVWVLDTFAWRERAEVAAGKTPHTGPGAVWGGTAFVPSLGEGTLAAIDLASWTLKKLIPTGGAGLFVRGYPDDPSYRFVWADTAFGKDRQDQIHVIDAKSLETVKTIVPAEGKRAVHPEFTRDGKFVYVAVWGGDMVKAYDATTFEEVASVGAYAPSGVSSVGARVSEPGL